MGLFKLLSIINAIACIIVVYRMIVLINKRDIPWIWNTYYWVKFTGIVLIFLGQFYTLVKEDEFVFMLKMASMFICLSTFIWCDVIEKDMQRKEEIEKLLEEEEKYLLNKKTHTHE